jgi:hypothetical protein
MIDFYDGWLFEFVMGWLVCSVFLGMDYSAICLGGLLNNYCDGELLWFLMTVCYYGFVFALVHWLFVGLWLCLGCYELFLWCYGGWLFWNVVCMFAFLEYGKTGKGYPNYYILYIIYLKLYSIYSLLYFIHYIKYIMYIIYKIFFVIYFIFF